MANNLLDQLNEGEVPPPPEQLRQDVHQRVNQWLLAAQTAELVLRAFSYAALQFAVAVMGLMNFTVVGKYELNREDEKDRDTEKH